MECQKENVLWLHVDVVTSWYERAIREQMDAYDLRPEEIAVLKRFGQVRRGKTISRDILVSADMPLYAVHYVLQRAFGFQNCHLHKFNLSESDVARLTEEKKENWEALVGTIFRNPLMDEADIFWADDYEKGSIRNWLRSKYTDPSPETTYGETYEGCQAGITGLHSSRLAEHYSKERFEDLSRIFELDPFSLLERLPIGTVLLEAGDAGAELPAGGEVSKPFAHELLYNYDFGDDWTLRLTIPGAPEQLVNTGLITEKKLQKSLEKLLNTKRPVMVAHDGLLLLDDVGGMTGFCDFLEIINRDPYEEMEHLDGESLKLVMQETKETKEWAYSFGWEETISSDMNWL